MKKSLVLFLLLLSTSLYSTGWVLRLVLSSDYQSLCESIEICKSIYDYYPEYNVYVLTEGWYKDRDVDFLYEIDYQTLGIKDVGIDVSGSFMVALEEKAKYLKTCILNCKKYIILRDGENEKKLPYSLIGSVDIKRRKSEYSNISVANLIITYKNVKNSLESGPLIWDIGNCVIKEEDGNVILEREKDPNLLLSDLKQYGFWGF